MNESRILTTLCYIERDEKYLMMHRVKKEQDPSAGKWIGVGGHFLEAESPDECLLREVREETGLQLTSYLLRGIVTFVSDQWGYEYMFLYTADGFEGCTEEEALSSCSEGILRWIPKAQIADLNLWEGDRIFLKLLLEQAGFFTLKLVYRGDTLIEKELRCEA